MRQITLILPAILEIKKVRSRDRGGDRANLNLSSAGAFRGGKQQSAAIKCDFSLACKEAEERIGANTGNRQVGKLQFGARIPTRLERTIPRDDIARDGFGIPGQERNDIDCFGDFRSLERAPHVRREGSAIQRSKPKIQRLIA